MGSGAKIEMKYKDRRVVFSSSNTELAKGLNQLGQKHGIDIARMYNRHSEKIERVELPNEKQFFKAMAGDKVDDYLQKKYEINQARNQRQHKLGR